ncbi:MAG: cupin domain-containing protein [SAR202 cluster bacterium]|nr:cupin domain-containing protein [SAR202 cluster bacterium]
MPDYFPDPAKAHRRELAPGVTLSVMWGDRLMLSVVELAEGSQVPMHSHPHEQAGMVVEGAFTFVIGGESRLLRKGDVYIIPGGVEHGILTLKAPARALDIFTPPREDYKP